jgi:uncharacterized protein (TIGR02118 family)
VRFPLIECLAAGLPTDISTHRVGERLVTYNVIAQAPRAFSGGDRMISILVLYANQKGSKFDFEYYTSHHLPLVRRLLEPMGMRSLTYVTERALESSESASLYWLIAELRFDDMESTRAALASHGAETQADIPHFTDVAPVIVIGELATG